MGGLEAYKLEMLNIVRGSKRRNHRAVVKDIWVSSENQVEK